MVRSEYKPDYVTFIDVLFRVEAMREPGGVQAYRATAKRTDGETGH